MRNILLLMIIIVMISPLSFAQPNWQKGGNNLFPIGSQPTIGTDASWNAPFRFLTRGNERMRLNEDIAITAGYIGSGAGYFASMNLLYPAFLPNNANGFCGLGTTTPRSMFHIQGPVGAGLGTGWRPWMRTGT